MQFHLYVLIRITSGKTADSPSLRFMPPRGSGVPKLENGPAYIYVVGNSKSQSFAVAHYALFGRAPQGVVMTREEDCKKPFELDGRTVSVYILDAEEALKNDFDTKEVMRKGDGFIFVYTPRDEEKSMNYIREKYDMLLQRKGRKMACCVCANHSDENLGQVHQHMAGEGLAETWGCDFFPISMKTGFNVERALDSVVKLISEHREMRNTETRRKRADMGYKDTSAKKGNDAGGCCNVQ